MLEKTCQSGARKIFRFSEATISCIVTPFRSFTRDVRVVTNVERNAVDVIVPTDERRGLRTAKSCGPDAPTLASSPAFASKAGAGATVANKHWLTGESTK